MTTEQWRPPYAMHVLGEYDRREHDPVTGLPEPQRVRMVCEQCGATWQTMCATGQVRSHIARFASIHLHRDPFKDEPKKG